jgi:hypothetical protein
VRSFPPSGAQQRPCSTERHVELLCDSHSWGGSAAEGRTSRSRGRAVGQRLDPPHLVDVLQAHGRRGAQGGDRGPSRPMPLKGLECQGSTLANSDAWSTSRPASGNEDENDIL